MLPVKKNAPAAAGVQTKNAAGNFASSGTHHSGETQNFAPVHTERDVLEYAVGRQVLYPEHFFAAAWFDGRVYIRDFSAHHHRNQSVGGYFLKISAADVFPVRKTLTWSQISYTSSILWEIKMMV